MTDNVAIKQQIAEFRKYLIENGTAKQLVEFNDKFPEIEVKPVQEKLPFSEVATIFGIFSFFVIIFIYGLVSAAIDVFPHFVEFVSSL